MRKTIFVALVFLIMSNNAAVSADVLPFDEGLAAFRQEDYATALRLWRPLAEKGNGLAQYYLGFMYERGFGVAQSYADAQKWYRKVVSQSDDAIRSAHWSSNDDNRGQARDIARETRWWRRLAEEESKSSNERIEETYTEVKGGDHKVVNDLEVCLESAQKGDAYCQYFLGLMYYQEH